MSLKGPTPFSAEEVNLFKPYFIQWVSKSMTPTAIKEALGPQYDRFQVYAKIGLAQLQKKKLEEEMDALDAKHEVLTQQLQEIRRTKQQATEHHLGEMTNALGKIKITL